MSTDEQIKLLIELQKLDSQIFKLNRELAGQPIFIRNLDELFKQHEAAYKAKEEELKSLAIKRKEKEVDLQSKEDGIKKLQTQLYSIKTNKEYQAMEKEIAGQKADVSVVEEEIIKILDEIDECTKEVAAQKQALEAERKKDEEEKSKIHQKTKELEASLAQLNSERTALAQKAEKEFLTKYERILKAKNGLAMVNIDGDSCGGCNLNLPPQVINEVRLRKDIIFCGSCARILYSEDTNTEKETSNEQPPNHE